MDQSIQYPTWDDVGIPKVIVNAIKQLPETSYVLSYLIVNKVFRFHIKVQYTYECHSCGHKKTVPRVFEEYTFCEGCESTRLSAYPAFIMGKDRCQVLEESIIPLIIQKMNENYTFYFKAHPPNNFFQCGWMLKQVDTSHPANSYQEGRLFNSTPAFAQFVSGESIETKTQTIAICKAAVLCPFLWDDLYDWKYHVRKDLDRETPIFPLFNIWSKLEKTRRPSFRLTAEMLAHNINMAAEDGDEDHNG